MTNSDKNTVGFQLKQISTEQFAIIQDAFDNTNSEIRMLIGIKFGLNTDKKNIVSFVKVQFEQNKRPFLITEIANHFNIDEKAWGVFLVNENKLILPKGFASHLVMLTVGTLRGVLHTKTENTEFNQFILPTINVIKLIKDDVELNIE